VQTTWRERAVGGKKAPALKWKVVGTECWCPGDADLEARLRALRERRWDAAEQAWVVPVEQLPAVIETLTVPVTIEMDWVTPVEDFVEQHWTITPFEHQRAAVDFGLRHERWLLGDAPGLGKTAVGIQLAEERRRLGQIQHCLVITCVSLLQYNWRAECQKLGYTSKILGTVATRRGEREGGTAEKVAQITARPEEFFWIVNVEALRNEAVVVALQAALADGTLGMIITDESHRLKNPSAKQSKGFLALRAPYEVCMSGTPLVNSPLDFYTTLRWLGVEASSWWAFSHRYGRWADSRFPRVVGFQRLDELQQKVGRVLLRRRKEDVLNLPPKLVSTVYCELEPEQQALYREIRQMISTHLDEIVLSPSPLSRLIRLRQCTGTPALLTHQPIGSGKLLKLKEMLEEVEGGAVVFTSWAEAAKLLQQELGGLLIHGGVPVQERFAITERFQRGEERLLIGTVESIGTGLNLTASQTAFFFDSPWTRAAQEQGEDRVHRIGTTGTVNIYKLVTKGTIDERVEEIVTAKGLWADLMVDPERIPASKRRELIQWLIS